MSFHPVESAPLIDTYVINLPKRRERRKNIIKEFKNRSEFRLTIVDAFEESFGAMGLWKTLCLIVTKALADNCEFILICEDDHKFTRGYSEGKLRENINTAKTLNCDIMLGGASWSEDSIKINKSLFWTRSFSGLQFTIVFNKFFHTILNADLKGYDAADHYICDLSNNILLIHPFISVQRSYQYSDVTPSNNVVGRVKQLFSNTSSKLDKLRRVTRFFEKLNARNLNFDGLNFSELAIPTYIINLAKRTDRKAHILEQFQFKNEFQTTLYEAVSHQNGREGLWESIKGVVRLAIERDEDVVIICEDDHMFTEDYNNITLIQNILKAGSLGADVILGGVPHYQSAVKACENLYWVDEFYCTQFMVVYRKFFEMILNARFHESMTADGVISSISVNKLVLYPFVSVQKDFGYSDISVRENLDIRSASPFYETMARLEILANKHQVLNI
jgi:GR25 family glycosyltransferase involved in LPS biosynthesis